MIRLSIAVLFVAASSSAHAKSGAQMVADMASARAGYESCVKDQAVRLGAKNKESAETILKAVRSVCDAEWAAFSDSWPDAGGILAGEKIRVVTTVRTHAENDAIAALLVARAAETD